MFEQDSERERERGKENFSVILRVGIRQTRLVLNLSFRNYFKIAREYLFTYN